MSTSSEYLQYAEQCGRMVDDDPAGTHRDELVRMAAAWRKLAAEEERISDLVRAVDQLFPAKPAAAPAAEGPARRVRGLIPRFQDSMLFRRLSLQ